MKRILVTGGMGMLGFNICKVLSRDKNNEVVGTYNKKLSSFKDLPCNFKNVDLTNKEECLMATENIDEIYMCASKSYGAKLMNSNPKLLVTENIIMNTQLLDAAVENGVKKILYVSSSTVYPVVKYPVAENEDTGSLYPLYEGVGGMKRYSESLIKFYSKHYGIQFVIVRPANMYGPHDKFDDEYSHVIPALIKRACQKEDPFIVWGTGKNIRDFIYVEDAAELMVELMNTYCDNRIINIGSGEGIELIELVKAICAAAGYSPEIRCDISKPDAIPYRVLNTSQQNNMFQNYELTSMFSGIKKTMRWYDDNKR